MQHSLPDSQGGYHEDPKKFTLPPFKIPRTSSWLLTAAGILLVIGLVLPQQLLAVIYELALITLAALAGYWLNRSLFPKARL